MNEFTILRMLRSQSTFRRILSDFLSIFLPLVIVLLIVTVPSASGSAEFSTFDAGPAFVAMADHDYLAVVDPVSGAVTDTVDLAPNGCDFPWRVAIPPNGQSVWVSCRYSSSIVVLDRDTHEVLQTISDQQGPAGIAFTQDSAYALIGSNYYGEVVVIDTSTFATAAVIDTAESPISVVMHPYLPAAYVVHRLYEGSVSVIDTLTWTVSQQVKAGSNPHHAVISRDGSHLYLSNKGNNTVSVIDTRSLKQETEVRLDAMPRDLAIHPDGLSLYVTQSWGDAFAIIDTATNEVQQTVDVDPGDSFTKPWGMDVTCDGGTLITTGSGGWGEETRQVALTDTGTLTSVLLPMPDRDENGYPDTGARDVAVCPQYVAEGIFLFPAAQSQRAGRGEDAVYELVLFNFSGKEDSYALALGAHAWDSVLSTDAVGPLSHGESAVMTMTVTVPQDADWYATDSVTLTATSAAEPETYQETAVLITEAYAPPAMTVSPLSLSSTQDAGEVVGQTLDVANGAGVDLDFEIGTSFGPGTSFAAASTELYGYLPSWGFLRIIGLENDTNVDLTNLSDGSTIDQTSALARYDTWDAYMNSGTYFKVQADKPVVAVLTDGSYWGYTSFIPSIDSGPVGREFVFYHEQADPFLYVFAVDTADVELRDSNENIVYSKSLNAGEYWKLNPDSGVYHVTANGRIALELVAENAYTTVPGSEGQAVGQLFFFATDGWGSGAVAAFAYEDADIELYDLNDDSLLHSATLSAGEYWWQVGLEDRQLRLESSGLVEVWAGNTEGGTNIEDLGDDISFAGGHLGREYHLHSLMEGFVIFAPFDNTELTVDEDHYSLGKDGYLHFPDCCAAHKIVSSQPILVQTLGRDGSWNDIGAYLGGVVPHSGVPVPWLTADPTSGTLPTDSTSTVDITFDATGIQPGTHTADLIVVSNDPGLPFVDIPVEMLVEPTADMGRVSGSVTDAWTGEPLAAIITLDGVHKTDPTTAFEIWAVEGTYTLIAAAPGYASQEFSVEIIADGETDRDIALEPDMARLELNPEILDATVVEGLTTVVELTVVNSGPAELEVSFHELPVQEVQMHATIPALEHRKILYDRAHNEPRLSDYNKVAEDLIAAGATINQNFVYPIDAGVLAGYDVLWINSYGDASWTFDELAAVKSWLDDGGAVLVHGGESPATSGVAGLYEITYRPACSYGTTTDIAEHPTTTGVGQIRVDTCSYLTFGSSSVPVVMDNEGQPHVVAHEEKGGKMVVVSGSDFNEWLVDADDNRLLANNIFAWLAEPNYEDIGWLQSLVAEAEIAGHTSRTVTIQVGAKDLEKGTYEAILAIEHNDPNRATPARVPVSLNVISAAPIADFSAVPTSGAAPLLVNFSNLSTGDFNKCEWDFGDGSKSTICVDPSHTYSQAGKFTVSLQVTGPGGVDKRIKKEYITIPSRPLADFSASPISGAPPLKVQFTNLTTGDYNECLWDFGDDQTSDLCDDPQHTYSKPGIYTVNLEVTGPGGVGKMTRTNYITVHSKPLADFSASPTSGIAPLKVQFTNLSAGNYDECLWDFGDSLTADGCNGPAHTYFQPGAYTVILEVKGPGGNDQKVKTDFIIVHDLTSANFSATPTSGVPPLKVEFTNLSMGDYDDCLWDFGDGDTSAMCDDLSHTYTTSGKFTVSLKIKGPGSESDFTRTDFITVYTPPVAAFSASPSSGVPPLIVEFTNLSTGDYDECLWDFGDGSRESYCGNPKHEYRSAGDYTVVLTVTGAGGEHTLIDEHCVTVGEYFIFLPRIFGN